MCKGCCYRTLLSSHEQHRPQRPKARDHSGLQSTLQQRECGFGQILDAECPIVCKLADFGLSRSSEMQTNSFLQTKTESTCRGTPVFMAPEIQLEDLKLAGQQDLKKADIWSLGLMMFSMINPNLSHPYSAEFGRSGVPFSEKALRDSLRRQQLLCHDIKYETFRITQCWQIEDIFKLCTKGRPLVCDGVLQPSFAPVSREISSCPSIPGT